MLQIRHLLIALSLFLSLFLVACGTNTLSQKTTFTNIQGGTLSINYPEGWVTESEDRLLFLASSEELITQIKEVGQPSPRSGQMITSISTISPEMTSRLTTNSEESIASQIATVFIGDIINNIEEITIANRSAAIVTGTMGNSDINVIVIDVGSDTHAMIFAFTSQGEGESIIQTIKNMAKSMSYEAPTTDE